MAAWMQQFTLFSLMQGQLASGSESSIGCSAKSLPPPFLPPSLPPSFTFFLPPLSAFIGLADTNSSRVPEGQGSRDLGSLPPREVHGSCFSTPARLAGAPAHILLFSSRKPFSVQNADKKCKADPTASQQRVSCSRQAVFPSLCVWVLLQMQAFILSWQSFCHGDPARLFHKH